MTLLKKGDTIGLVRCSSRLHERAAEKIGQLVQVLEQLEVRCRVSEYLFTEASAARRAETLMKYLEDTSVTAVFDVSGGDLANEILDHLEYQRIAETEKPFFGYSDLTCVLNTLYAKTGRISYLYQIRNLVGADQERQQAAFKRSLFSDEKDLFDISWRFIQGDRMSGSVIGGNIRCFLKLAGTEYIPDPQGKILFLEALGGSADRISAMFATLRQLGIFDAVNGILLGTFTEMQREGSVKNAAEHLLAALEGRDIPIAVTSQVGHGEDSACIRIGAYYDIRDGEEKHEQNINCGR